MPHTESVTRYVCRAGPPKNGVARPADGGLRPLTHVSCGTSTPRRATATRRIRPAVGSAVVSMPARRSSSRGTTSQQMCGGPTGPPLRTHACRLLQASLSAPALDRRPRPHHSTGTELRAALSAPSSSTTPCGRCRGAAPRPAPRAGRPVQRVSQQDDAGQQARRRSDSANSSRGSRRRRFLRAASRRRRRGRCFNGGTRGTAPRRRSAGLLPGECCWGMLAADVLCLRR